MNTIIAVIITVLICTGVSCVIGFLVKAHAKNGDLYKCVVKTMSTLSDISTALLKSVDKNTKETSTVERINMYLRALVKTAERLPEWNQEYKNLSKEELNEKQHQYVKDSVIQFLQVDNIMLDNETMKALDSLINNAVALYLEHGKKKSNK